MFASDTHKLLTKVISAGIIRGIIVSPAKKLAGKQGLADVHVYLTKTPYPPIPANTWAGMLAPYWHKHVSLAHYPSKKDYLNDEYLNASPASYKQPLQHELAKPSNDPDIFQTPQKPAKGAKKIPTKKPIQPAPPAQPIVLPSYVVYDCIDHQPPLDVGGLCTGPTQAN